MELLSLNDIIIPSNRLRRNFDEDKLEELAQSISKFGLFNAIVLHNGEPVLSSGERRLRAIAFLESEGCSISFDGKMVPAGFVPCVRLAELPELARLEAELDENIKRDDLTFAEVAAAYKRLHDLRVKQGLERGEIHTLKDTAIEILGKSDGGSQDQKVKDHILLADYLSDPDIAKAKDHKEAMKILRKKKEAQNYVRLSESTTVTPSHHTLIRGDSRESLRLLESETFSCIIADPPYGVDADSFGSMAANPHTYSDSLAVSKELYTILADEGFRVATKQCHLYVFCDLSRFEEISLLFTIAGWRVWKTPLIWYKHGGMLPEPEHGPRRTYECILYALKGEKKVNFVAPDVIDMQQAKEIRRGAEKPVALYTDLLSRSTSPGDRVLDPFAGTGPIFTAANTLKVFATGIEIDPAAQGMCLEAMQVMPEDSLLKI